MDFTGLVVPVPSVDWLVLDRRPASRGLALPAHVTLIAPFVPPGELTDGHLAELATLFSDVVPFSFALQETAEFPDGTVYLAPEPATPFRQLTHALAKVFPEYPPYEGRFEDVVPHLTVPLLEHETVDDVARLVSEHAEKHGPPRGYAQEAQLLVVRGEDLEVRAEFPFGMAAA